MRIVNIIKKEKKNKKQIQWIIISTLRVKYKTAFVFSYFLESSPYCVFLILYSHSFIFLCLCSHFIFLSLFSCLKFISSPSSVVSFRLTYFIFSFLFACLSFSFLYFYYVINFSLYIGFLSFPSYRHILIPSFCFTFSYSSTILFTSTLFVFISTRSCSFTFFASSRHG